MEARVNAEKLIEFLTAVYRSAGIPEADARLVADSLVQADLWGHQSHGVLRTGWYLARLKSGVMGANDVRYRKEGLLLPADTLADLAKIAKCSTSEMVRALRK